LVSSSNIKQQITKPGDIKMNKKAAKAQKKGLAESLKKGKAARSLKKGVSKVIKKNMGGGLSPNKAKELNNIMNASQGIAENLQKQSMVRRKRGGIIDGNDLVSSYYE
jgi:hypothetical protein